MESGQKKGRVSSRSLDDETERRSPEKESLAVCDLRSAVAPPEATVRKRSEADVAERSDSGLEFIPEGSNNGG